VAVSSPPRTLHIGSLEVEHRRESIVAVARSVDAVVSSDDNYLSRGGGVSRALWDSAGPIDRSLLSLPASLGDVLATSAGRLGCRTLYHAVSIDLDSGERANAGQVQALTRRVLKCAARDGIGSLALPVFASGAGLLGPRIAAAAMVEGLAIAAETLHGVPARVVLTTLPDDVATSEAVALALASVVTREELERRLQVLEAAAGLAVTRDRSAAFDDLDAVERTIDAALALLHRPARAVGADAARQPTEKTRALLDILLTSPFPHRREMARELTEIVEQRHMVVNLGDTESLGATRRVAIRHRTAAFIDLALVDAGLDDTSRDRPAEPSTGPGPSVVVGAVTSTGVIGGIVGTLAGVLGNGHRAAPAPNLAAGAPGGKRPGTRPLEFDASAQNAPVRALARLAREAFSSSDLERLDADLEAAGYRGPPDDRLLEHCVRVPHPARWLANFLKASELRERLEHLGRKVPPGRDSVALAEHLLVALGFPAVGVPRGLRHAKRALERARSRVHAVDDLELCGLVVAASAELEHMLLVLIRFVSLVAFRRPPEIVLAAELGKGRTPLTRRGLGGLVELVGQLSKRLERDGEGDVEARRWRQTFGSPVLLPSGFERAAQLRNAFAHEGREVLREDDTRRPDATKFLDLALELVEFLSQERHGARMFPRVIVPRRVVIDSWGRRIIEADSDEGPTEFLFTDQAFRPGRVYYMHTITNPFRMNPLLFPADDMVEGLDALESGRPE
jgi:O-acetyl-ADP-ribose deacetylase (regulator of RNase III)